jgi:hypothetical protein
MQAFGIFRLVKWFEVLISKNGTQNWNFTAIEVANEVHVRDHMINIIVSTTHV